MRRRRRWTRKINRNERRDWRKTRITNKWEGSRARSKRRMWM